MNQPNVNSILSANRQRAWHRCVSFVLALLLFVSDVPFWALSVENGEDSAGTSILDVTEIEKNVNQLAIFDWWSDFLLVSDPTVEDIADQYSVGTNWYSYDFLEASGLVATIEDSYYDTENGYVWYKLGPCSGETLPEVLQAKPWVLYCIDTDIADGFDPYLAIYDKDDTIRFVSTIYGASTENPVQVEFVVSGPAVLADAEITFTECAEGDYTLSGLAYTEETYGTTWSRGVNVSIIKADGMDWTDGEVGIRYYVSQFADNTYTADAIYGAAFVYQDGVVHSANNTDYATGYESSDVVYTNAANAVLVFEIMDPSFMEVNQQGYFSGASVLLFDNTLASYVEHTVSTVPTPIMVQASVTADDTDWYWIACEETPYAGYFLIPADQVTFDIVTETDVPDAPTPIVSANGVSVFSSRVLFTGLTVSGLPGAPKARYIRRAVAFDVIPKTEAGIYTGAAQLTIPIPDGWDSTKVFGYVRESDGTLTAIPGTVNRTGTFTFTTPHFSEVGLFEASTVAEVVDNTVTLEIGETSEVITVFDNQQAEESGPHSSANKAIDYEIGHVTQAGDTTVTKVNAISDGDTVVISDGNGNYLMRSGTTVTTTTDASQATQWTVDETNGYYTLSNNGYYLRPRNGSNYLLNVSNSNQNTNNRRWSYSGYTGFYYGNRYLNYNSGWSVAQNVTANYGAVYTYTTTEAKNQTTVTFTGTDVTPGTEVEIGSKTYTVIVNPKHMEKDQFLKSGSSVELNALSDLELSGFDVTYSIVSDENSVLSLADNTITANTASAGEATVLATATNDAGTEVATVTYAVTVSEVEITDSQNIYVPIGGTHEIEGLTGELYTSMLDSGIATIDPESGTLTSGSVTITGVAEGHTSFVVGTTQFNVHVTPTTEETNTTTKYLYVEVDKLEGCEVYYAINGGELHKVEGTGVLIDQSYTGGINIIFFAKPLDGYAVTYMGATGSKSQFYTLAGDEADGSDSNAWPFDEADQTTVPSNSDDSAWKSGHGYRWALLEGNMTIEDLRDLFTRAIAMGCDSTTCFTKNNSGTSSNEEHDNNLNTTLSFISQPLPTFSKKILYVNGVAYDDTTPLEFGNVVTYQFTITGTSDLVDYTDITVTDDLIGQTVTFDNIDANGSDSTSTGGTSWTYSQTATYTITADDVAKYAGGTFKNNAVLNYTYSSTYSSGTETAQSSASVECSINGIVSYEWMDGLPAGLIGSYTLPTPFTFTVNTSFTVPKCDKYGDYKELDANGHVIRIWSFQGWEYGGEMHDPNEEFIITPPKDSTDSITLVGKWTSTPAAYTVTWMEENGTTELEKDEDVAYGTTPSFDGETPTKASNGRYNYVFAGWKSSVDDTVYAPSEIPTVTQNVTYTAYFAEEDILGEEYKIYIGVNLAYHQTDGTYKYPDGTTENAYHKLPDEPVQLEFNALRAMLNDDTWTVTVASASGDDALPSAPGFYIEEGIFTDDRYQESDYNGTSGIFDDGGLKEYLTGIDYDAIITAWLTYMGSDTTTDVIWSEYTADNCEIIPYVIKRQSNGNWYVDMVILLKSATLTIEATGDQSRTFLYEVSDGTQSMIVSVPGGSSVTIHGLTSGKQYTVKALTDWSWEYSKNPTWSFNGGAETAYDSTTGVSVELTSAANTLKFVNSLNDPGWLGGEGREENIFTGVSEVAP